MRIIKNLCKGFGVFLGSFLVIHIIASSFYEVGPDGYLQAPNSYPIVLVLVSAILTFMSFRSPIGFAKRVRGKERLPPLDDIDMWQSEKESQYASSTEVIEVSPIEDQAATIIFEAGYANTSLLQRKMKLGYAEAASVIDQLEVIGLISGYLGAEPRTLYMSQTEYESRKKIVSNPRRDQVQVLEKVNVFPQYSRINDELLLIDLMEGHDFEYWCAGLLRNLGFAGVEVTPGSGDQGVDILAQKDGIKYAIQCKCYSSDLGNKPIQEVHAGQTMYHCQVGAVLTNRHFTQGGRKLAAATGVLLWDRDWIISALQKVKSEITTSNDE